MARITVEDCLKMIPNRFELALAATYRARQLAQGHTPKIESRDKPTVVALREIAAGQVGVGGLQFCQQDPASWIRQSSRQVRKQSIFNPKPSARQLITT